MLQEFLRSLLLPNICPVKINFFRAARKSETRIIRGCLKFFIYADIIKGKIYNSNSIAPLSPKGAISYLLAPFKELKGERRYFFL